MSCEDFKDAYHALTRTGSAGMTPSLILAMAKHDFACHDCKALIDAHLDANQLTSEEIASSDKLIAEIEAAMEADSEI